MFSCVEDPTDIANCVDGISSKTMTEPSMPSPQSGGSLLVPKVMYINPSLGGAFNFAWLRSSGGPPGGNSHEASALVSGTSKEIGDWFCRELRSALRSLQTLCTGAG